MSLGRRMLVTWGPGGGAFSRALAGRHGGLEPLREQIAVIAQDHGHWPLSVRDNIMMGRPLDGALLTSAAASSGAGTVIAELDRGYDTHFARQPSLRIKEPGWRERLASSTEEGEGAARVGLGGGDLSALVDGGRVLAAVEDDKRARVEAEAVEVAVELA